MGKANCIISPGSRKRLMTQGFVQYSDTELKNFRFGIRFAYAVCAAIVLLGFILNSITFIVIGAAIAFGGMIPPRHPVDYLYNYIIRFIIKKPAIPPRPVQSRFACSIAFVLLGVIIYLKYENYDTAACFTGVVLLSSAALVSTIDFCIPSMIYNTVFKNYKMRSDKLK